MNDELLAQSKKLKCQSPVLIPIRTYVFQGATAPLHNTTHLVPLSLLAFSSLASIGIEKALKILFVAEAWIIQS